MSWVANEEAFVAIVNVINAAKSGDNNIRHAGQQKLDEYGNTPDFIRYLMYIMYGSTNSEEGFDSTRQAAGLLLKNKIKSHYLEMDMGLRTFIKAASIHALGAVKPRHLANTLATLITTIVTCEKGLHEWTELAPSLLNLLNSPVPSLVEGAFNSLYFICEDMQETLMDERCGRPIDVMIPKCLEFFSNPNHVFRRYAIGCINHYILLMPPALIAHLETFVRGLSSLAIDVDPIVRQRVCNAIGLLCDVQLPFLMPNLKSIIDFMLQATQDKEELVAMEATEFWSILCDSAENFENEETLGYIENVLYKLVPILLRGLAYNDEDPALDAEDDNNDILDRATDIKPRFHKSRMVESSGAGARDDDEEGGEEGEGEEGGEDDDKEEDDDDDDVSAYNLRKCSAASLDIIAKNFGHKILPFLIPELNLMFNSSDWKIQEASILALGAVADGCIESVETELGGLFGFLLGKMLYHPRALIRAITTWTIARYACWTLREPSGNVLPAAVKGLLERVLDHNKKVQEDACSNLAIFEEEAGKLLLPYISPMLQCFAEAFKIYQKKNLVYLYDVVGSLAESVGTEINKPEYISIIIPPLITLWNTVPDDDQTLCHLLECLTSFANNLGTNFKPMADGIYERCLRIIQNTLLISIADESDAEMEFVVCSIDLLSGLTEGLKEEMMNIIVNYANSPKDTPDLRELLFHCMQSSQPDVRLSAFALIGDLCKHGCFEYIRDAVPNYLPLMIHNLTADNDRTKVTVANNSTWAIGEIAIKSTPESFEPYIAGILQRVIPMINYEDVSPNVAENIAITLGRIGIVCAKALATRYPEFLAKWCQSISKFHDNLEKDQAFRGLINILQINPTGALKDFYYLADAIGSWDKPKEDLAHMFHEILHSFKNTIGPGWNDYFKNFPPTLRSTLQKRYGL